MTIAQLFREEKVWKALLEFIRKMGVGRMCGMSRPEGNQEESKIHEEREGENPGM